MILWVDAQVSPRIAGWIETTFQVPAHSLRKLGLRDADDITIFRGARAAYAIILTKDRDFKDLLERYGSPPKVIWLISGNSSNKNLQELLARFLLHALAILRAGENPVALGDPGLLVS